MTQTRREGPQHPRNVPAVEPPLFVETTAYLALPIVLRFSLSPRW